MAVRVKMQIQVDKRDMHEEFVQKNSRNNNYTIIMLQIDKPHGKTKQNLMKGKRLSKTQPILTKQ